MSKQNSEPAFPVDSVAEHEYCGMSLRDYFAAKAMSAIISNTDAQLALNGLNKEEGMRVVSALAYSQADAMLAERAK